MLLANGKEPVRALLKTFSEILCKDLKKQSLNLDKSMIRLSTAKLISENIC